MASSLSGLFEHISPLGFVWQLLKPLQPPSASGKKASELLHRNQVPPMFREPYIIKGYRPTDTTFSYAFKAIFRWHNDVGNFWTHFIPFCIFVIWFLLEWKWRTDFTDPYFYPLACLWAGSCCYTLFSSTAHLLGCVSYRVRTICFFLDYLGIAMYTIGGGIMAFFYHLSLGSVFYDYKYPILSYYVVLTICATLLTSLSRFYWYRYRFIIRVLAFFLPYVNTTYPIAIRMLTVCIPTRSDCVMETLFLHVINGMLVLLLSFFFVSKIPERFAPGKFDYVFQSHQLFHVSAAIETMVVFYMIPIDAAVRREIQSEYDAIRPDFFTTFGMFGIAFLGSLLVVVLLGGLVLKDILKPNLNEIKED